MSPRAAELLAEILGLPASDRDEVVARLLDDPDPPSDDPSASDEELAAELDRRAEECRRDPSAVVPWEQVRRELEAELPDAR